LEDQKVNMAGNNAPGNEPSDLGNEILKLLGERTKNPGEAFVLLQQLSIFIWNQYKVDWTQHEDANFAGGRKQRCLDYISHLMDAFTREEAETAQADSTQPQGDAT
jgi:hypothetical protein